jgi:hypothetical protein
MRYQIPPSPGTFSLQGLVDFFADIRDHGTAPSRLARDMGLTYHEAIRAINLYLNATPGPVVDMARDAYQIQADRIARAFARKAGDL